MTTISSEAQAQSGCNQNIETLPSAGIPSSENPNESFPFSQNQESEKLDSLNLAAEDASLDDEDSESSQSSDVQQNDAVPPKGYRMRFKNLTPLRKKTLELLRENPDLDGATADRLARESLGLPAQVSSHVFSRAKVVEGAMKNKNQFVPARGNFGTSSRNDLNKDSMMERLQGLSFADRKEALLAALSAAAEKSRRR